MADKRVTVTVKLHPINDADLIRQVNSIAQGARQQRLKAVLRAGFELPIPSPVKTPAEALRDELRSELVDIQGEISGLRAFVQRGGNGTAAGDAERLSRVEAALSELTTWAQGAHDRLEQIYAGGVTSPAQLLSEPEPQPANLLSTDQARARENRMKRNQW